LACDACGSSSRRLVRAFGFVCEMYGDIEDVPRAIWDLFRITERTMRRLHAALGRQIGKALLYVLQAYVFCAGLWLRWRSHLVML
jgi:hypothetical protein